MALSLATAGSAAPVLLLGYFAAAAAGGVVSMPVAFSWDTAAAVDAAGVAAVMVSLLRYQYLPL